MRSYYSFGIYLELSNPPKTKTGKPIIGTRLDRKTDYWSKIETENRVLEQDWTGKPIIGTRLGAHDSTGKPFFRTGKPFLVSKPWQTHTRGHTENTRNRKTDYWHKIAPESRLYWSKIGPENRLLTQHGVRKPIFLPLSCAKHSTLPTESRAWHVHGA